MDAVGVRDPGACVYVGDRLFDDVWGARNAGLRAVHVPLSSIPASQLGHTEGEPDASVTSLLEIPGIVRGLERFVTAASCKFVRCRNVQVVCAFATPGSNA